MGIKVREREGKRNWTEARRKEITNGL